MTVALADAYTHFNIPLLRKRNKRSIMAMTAMPMLIHGPDAYFSGWEQPAAPIPRWAELAGDIPRIVDKIIFPILNSEDITVIFPEKWTDFKEWRDMAAESPSDLDALLQGEDAIDGELQRIFTKSSERLGDEWTRALLGGLRFRKVVRETVLRHADIWPEDSWNTIARPMALNELCLVCILHHLETGEGREINVQMLAHWSYKYADYAYLEAGYGSSDLGLGHKLERAE